jgi:hypothetical protein
MSRSPRNLPLSPWTLHLVFLVIAGPLMRAGNAAEHGPAKPSSTTELHQMEAWWSDLEKDEAAASRALLLMSTRPEQAVAFLKDNLKPLTLDSVRLKAYLLRLGSPNEAVWRKAFEDLEYYDPRLAMDLQTLMDKVTETPARQRMVEILSSRDPGSLKEWQVKLRNHGDVYMIDRDKYSWYVEHKISRINSIPFLTPKRKWTRAVRGIALLEHIGTPGAVAILRDVATGHPEAQPTRVAIESLHRLAANAR